MNDTEKPTGGRVSCPLALLLGDRQCPDLTIPPGYKLRIELVQELPDLSPIVYDMNKEDAEKIWKELAENIQGRLKANGEILC